MFKIALPTGKLEAEVVNFLEERGIFIPKRRRKMQLEINHEVIGEIWFAKSQHIPELVLTGKVEMGISSTEWIEEFRLDTNDSFRLGTDVRYVTRYAEKFQKHFVFPFGQTKIGIFCKKGNKKSREGDIISEFPCITREFIGKLVLCWEPQIYLSRGGTEAMVMSGLYRYGVCTIDTGETLAENSLECLGIIMDSQVVAFARSEHYGDDREIYRRKVYDFIKILKAGD